MDEETTDALKITGLKHHGECLNADIYSCEEAIRRLNEYLDHQLTEGERVIVLKHLELCKPCFRRFTFEQTLIVSLRQRMICLCMPVTLREKLSAMLRNLEE